jgi:uncharacterized membrane protein YkvA (DUF1232 family)
MTDAERITVLQGMMDTFTADVVALQVAVADGRTPDLARRALAAALVYVVNRFDLVPDHLEGVGLADDAAVLRLAAKNAVSYGADDPELRRIAGEASDLHDVFGELVGPLEDYLNKLQWQATDGKTPADVIADPTSRVALWQELSRRIDTYKPQRVVAEGGDPAKQMKVLASLLRSRLDKAGFGK